MKNSWFELCIFDNVLRSKGSRNVGPESVGRAGGKTEKKVLNKARLTSERDAYKGQSSVKKRTQKSQSPQPPKKAMEISPYQSK